MSELNVAQSAARAGGEVVARYFRDGVTMRSKGTSDLVSDADVEAEQAIVATIRRAFPGHAILAEEEHRAEATAEHLWVIDPLDGTTNFAHRIPHFAVSIGYYRAGQPVCGVIYQPLNGDWFVASRGQGAFHNGQPVRVGPQRSLEEVLVGVGFYYDHGVMMERTLLALRDLIRMKTHGVRRFGTASLDLAFVACGQFAAFFEYELSPWDFAAGRLFVEEAGGRVTTCRGEELPLRKSSVLATNGWLHDDVLRIVSEHVPPGY